ncbi:MAG: hypothetical protein JWP56_1500 [Aeromicrobium sp.]|nr:hypothetical protein [Aeromicrobium sp.]
MRRLTQVLKKRDALSHGMATIMPVTWQPGRRKAERALEAPYEGVPDHLRQPLFDWIAKSLNTDYGLNTQRLSNLAVHLRIDLGSGSNHQYRALAATMHGEREFMLDVAEALLEMHGWDDGRAQNLSATLQSANSAYAVTDRWNGLEHRIAPGVKDAVAAAVSTAGGSAGDHLTSAWNGAYGRQSDPVKSYSESIKAVESALAKHVSPQNGRQTLGTMIKDVGAKPSKWKFAIADGNTTGVGTVLSMMQMLWDGQTSRHGGLAPTRAETLNEARAAVHLAATLVQFGASGAFAPA